MLAAELLRNATCGQPALYTQSIASWERIAKQHTLPCQCTAVPGCLAKGGLRLQPPLQRARGDRPAQLAAVWLAPGGRSTSRAWDTHLRAQHCLLGACSPLLMAQHGASTSSPVLWRLPHSRLPREPRQCPAKQLLLRWVVASVMPAGGAAAGSQHINSNTEYALDIQQKKVEFSPWRAWCGRA